MQRNDFMTDATVLASKRRVLLASRVAMRAFVAERSFGHLLLVLALLCASQEAAAQAARPDRQAIAEAQARFKRGLELYDEGNPEASLIELRRAYDLAPNYKIQYNVAQVELSSNDYASALRAFEKYLADGGNELEAKRRSEVQKEIERLSSRVAMLAVTTNVSDAQLTLDEASPLTTPLTSRIAVNPGRHKLVAAKPGFAEVTRVIEVAGGDQPTVHFELISRTEQAVPAPPAAAERQPRSPAAAASPSPAKQITSDSTRVWIGWTATGALALGATVTGFLALGASGNLQDERNRFGTTEAELESKQSSTRTLALVSDVLTVGTLAVGGLSLYWTLSRDSSAKSSVSLGVSPSAARLQGTF